MNNKIRLEDDKLLFPLPQKIDKNIKSLEQNVSQYQLRPQTLKEFIGQKEIKQILEISLSASLKTGKMLDHVLATGQPGLGKTTIANIIAKELNSTSLILTSGPILERPGDLATILASMDNRTIIFIDEIHRLSPNVEEILYSAMEDKRIDILTGTGSSSKNVSIPLPDFTLIGATTRSGMLTAPLRDRFGLDLKFELYDIDDLKCIVILAFEKMKIANKIVKLKIDIDAAFQIALASRGTPRIALKIAKRVFDFSLAKSISIITQKTIYDVLELLDIDKNGISKENKDFLKIISKNYNGGPVGINAIATILGEDKKTIEDIYEPYLLKIGFVQRTSRGRILTDIGFKYVKDNV